MKYTLYFSFLLFNANMSLAQDVTQLQKVARPIISDAHLLYRCEMASLKGKETEASDDWTEDARGGSISYPDGDNTICVFYTAKDTTPYLTIVFDTTFKYSTAIKTRQIRPFTDKEKTYYEIKAATEKLVKNDTFFKTYEHTELVIIPILKKDKMAAYVVTRTSDRNIIPLGNDHLIRFDDNFTPIYRERIHDEYLPMNIATQTNVSGEVHTEHEHIKGKNSFMTATDISTFMLYEPDQVPNYLHTVTNDEYISIWSTKNKRLLLIARSLKMK
jgi:hypothetical protein